MVSSVRGIAPALRGGAIASSAALGACMLLAIAACGGSKPAAASQTGRDAANATLPPIPTQPLRLVPQGAQQVVSADLKQLRASRHFATVERWIHRYTCMDADAAQWLLARTDRVVIATFEEPSGRLPRGLAVLRGHYQAGDLERAHTQASALMPAPNAGAATEQQRGRFRLLTSGAASAAQLGDGLIALGDRQHVLAALDVADGKHPAWNEQDALIRDLDADRWLSEHSAAMITRVSERTAQRIGRELSPIGGRRLGENLNQSSAALAFVLASDFDAQAEVQYADAQSAAEAADGLRSLLARADLVLRLTGLPSALDSTSISAEAERLHVSLKLSADYVDRLSSRLQVLLDNDTPACGTQAARPLDAPAQHAAR
jgi:hypothetical protein